MYRKLYLLMLCLGVLSLGGCGGEYASISSDRAVSEGAVSGGAVREQTVKSKQEKREDSCPPFCTDTNWYWMDWNGEDDYYLVQSRRDGTGRKTIKFEDVEQLISVREDALYVATSEWNDDDDHVADSIWRIPLEKDEKGFDQVLVKDAERIAAETDDTGEYQGMEWDSFTMASHTLYYLIFSGGMQLAALDLDTGNKKIMDLPAVGSELWGDETSLFSCGDRIFLFLDDIGVFVRNHEEGDWRKLADCGEVFLGFNRTVTWNQDTFYYVEGFMEEDGTSRQIHKYDLDRGTDSLLVSREQLKKAVEAAEGLDPDKDKLDDFGVVDLFCQADRLYIQVQANWYQGEEYHMACQMFSQGQGEPELRYEKELTSCMGSYGEGRGEIVYDPRTLMSSSHEPDNLPKPKKVKNAVWNMSKCCRIQNGKAFLRFHEEDTDEDQDSLRFGSYDLETGEFCRLTPEDEGYFELLYPESQDLAGVCDVKTYELYSQKIFFMGPCGYDICACRFVK